MKRMITTTVFAVAVLMMLTVSSCKNDPEVKIPLIKYILINEEYLDVKSGLTEYTDSMAMKYNSDMQLESIIGLNFQYDMEYDEAGRLSKTEIINNQSGKANGSSFIEYTWTSNTVTAQEYWGPMEPTYWKTVITFNNSDQMTKIEYFEEPNKGEWYLMGYADCTWTNGNLTKYEEYGNNWKSSSLAGRGFSKTIPSQITEIPLAKGSMEGELKYVMEVEYDNKTNPFVMYPALAILFADEMPHIFTSKNNPTFSANSEYIEGTNTWDVDFTYEFDEKGFPIEVVHIESYDDWQVMETWTIKYL